MKGSFGEDDKCQRGGGGGGKEGSNESNKPISQVTSKASNLRYQADKYLFFSALGILPLTVYFNTILSTHFSARKKSGFDAGANFALPC